MARYRSQKVNVHGRNTDRKHIRVDRYLYVSPAWESLSPAAKVLWLELTFRHNGENNGKIFLSFREAKKILKCGNSIVKRAFGELEDRGFIRVTKKGGFSQKHATEGSRATEYKLVHLVKTDDPDFRAYMKWHQ